MRFLRNLGVSEILAAVALVSLVGALSLPMVLRDRQAPSRTACMVNMKQIGASLTMYAGDYDEVLPRTTEDRPKRHFGAHWTYLIQPYVRSEAVFVCPADPAPAYTYVDDWSQRKKVPRLSYINNYTAIPAHDFYPVPISVLTDPNSLILLGERRSHHNLIGAMPGWKGTSGFVPGQPCRDLAFAQDYRRVTEQQAAEGVATATTDKDLLMVRLDWTAHGEASNYTFADGHAAHQTLTQTLDPTHFEWGERFYPRSMDNAHCDGRPRPTRSSNE